MLGVRHGGHVQTRLVSWTPVPLLRVLAAALLGGRAMCTDSVAAGTCCSTVLVSGHGAGGMGGYFQSMSPTAVTGFDADMPM